MPACPRVLFYAVNGLGLGHVTRLLAIARRLRDLVPRAEIVFLTSSEAEDVLFREGFAAFKVPSKSLRVDAHIRPTTYSRMVQTVSLNLLASFHPHLFVVDTFPTGALQELLPVLRWDSRKAFVYREQRPESAMSDQFQSALRLYDLAIVPHLEDAAEIVVPPELPTVWCGPILVREREEALSRAEAREELGLAPDGRTLYLTLGGGGEAGVETLLSEVAQALLPEAERQGIEILAPRAPLVRGRIARIEGVRRVSHYPMAEMYNAFDACISAGGYNSVMELLHHGVPTALWPLARQVDDQEARAEWVESQGAGIRLASLEESDLHTALGTLMDPVEAAMMRENAEALSPGGGALRAAEALAGLL